MVRLPVLVPTAVALAAAGMVAQGQEKQGWGEIRPALEASCLDCHDGDARKGDLDMEALPGSSDRVHWLSTLARMRDRIAVGEMPPPDKDRLDPALRDRLSRWLSETVRAGVATLSPEPGRVTVRRLSRGQYDNTVRDLFGVSTELAAAFPADDLGYGFDSIGDAMSFSTLHLEKNLAAAEDVARQVVDTEDPDQPTVRRFEAENMRLLRDSGAGMDGDIANLYTRSEIEQVVDLPRDGVYRLDILCYGDQAGDQPCRMSVRLDGRELDEIDVPERKPANKRLEVRLRGGRHRIGLAFLNDFYDPKNPEPTQRDRNLKIDSLAVVGPTDPREVPAAQQWFQAADPQRGRPAVRSKPILRELLLRAWRRPPTTGEIDRLARLCEQAVSGGESFHGALRLCVQAALASPHFLFRVEAGGTQGRAGAAAPLPGHALAARLSYFLWASAPDDILRQHADRGRLGDGAVLAAEVDRMLADPRAESLATDFAAQWLELRNLQDRTPDPARFPGFDEQLRHALRRETELLFLAVLREGRDVRDLLDCDFTHANARLADFYGLPGEFTDQFVRVTLPPELRLRGGILGHASVHAVTANPTRTSPVKRGKWVLENVLDAPPPPPPPGNDSFPGEERIDSSKTLREQMAAHREKASCAVCHVRMDTLGYAFERFDAIGRYRESDAGGTIDTSGMLPDGRTVEGLAGLKAVLRDDPAFLRCLLHKLFVYAVGREAAPADRLRLWVLAEEFDGQERVTLGQLILAVVRMDAFAMRTVAR